MPKSVSAGILLYRTGSAPPFEVFLAHPGGPFWAAKDEGAWTIPKGAIEEGEDELSAACREFREETGIDAQGPFIDLGAITQKNKKVVRAWACEGDADPNQVTSNTTTVRWAGKIIEVPEIDRCAWFPPEEAILKINAAQADLVLRLAKRIA